MRPLAIDTGYMIRRRGRKPYIAVFESLSSWHQELAERSACYAALIGIKYRVPVHTYMLPLASHACPKDPPPFGKAVWGGVTVKARLNWIKPWEIDGGVVIERGWPELDPWAILFDLDDEQEDEVMRRLNENGR